MSEDKVGCSQCGGDFWPRRKGQFGFSHCADHKNKCSKCGEELKAYHSPGLTKMICVNKCDGFEPEYEINRHPKQEDE